MSRFAKLHEHSGLQQIHLSFSPFQFFQGLAICWCFLAILRTAVVNYINACSTYFMYGIWVVGLIERHSRTARNC